MNSNSTKVDTTSKKAEVEDEKEIFNKLLNKLKQAYQLNKNKVLQNTLDEIKKVKFHLILNTDQSMEKKKNELLKIIKDCKKKSKLFEQKCLDVIQSIDDCLDE